MLSVHGPGPLLLYAWFANLFGWGYSSILLVQRAVGQRGRGRVSSAGAAQAAHGAFLALSMLVYAPFVLYCCTSMTELANYGLLMLYAGLLYRLREKVTLPVLIGALCAVLFLSVYRILYFLLFVPVAVLACGKKANGKLALWLAAICRGLVFHQLLACVW